ncbi:sugar phosphate isomerase/epimerase family protein [Spirosoma linguale]|uniref:Xylose isomerase domain protein TIM barrel n=1 Tax=Spirosoma linguale (strain ATCC 33905 / DSM 74 / LMG 10896 / Claus 1) TaxID=504472 RepID=D2QPJ2_SPILD|nr:Xylose isomerase domain protein TIM barrel [Spirosoma linguale DSM 74]
MTQSRRSFLNQLGLAAAGAGLTSALPNQLFAEMSAKKFGFDISLAEFSFAGELMSGKMTNMDFPARAKNDFGINVLEYVSMFFNNKHTDQAYLKELKQRCDDLGMKSNLIMVDGANIADLDATKRKQAVESHYAWVDAAKFLGCSAIRVNLGDTSRAISGVADDPADEAAKTAADGYHKLLEYAAKSKMNVIVENHFGNSTDIDWLVGVLKQVNMPNAGLLPDFGNFCRQRSKPETNDIKGIMSTTCVKEYDRYEGVKKMMPYAKGISAKTHKFDAQGNETETDFRKMFKIIKDAGFNGYVGIEYEGGIMSMYNPTGGYLPTNAGIQATKVLLERVRTELA